MNKVKLQSGRFPLIGLTTTVQPMDAGAENIIIVVAVGHDSVDSHTSIVLSCLALSAWQLLLSSECKSRSRRPDHDGETMIN